MPHSLQDHFWCVCSPRRPLLVCGTQPDTAKVLRRRCPLHTAGTAHPDSPLPAQLSHATIGFFLNRYVASSPIPLGGPALLAIFGTPIGAYPLKQPCCVVAVGAHHPLDHPPGTAQLQFCGVRCTPTVLTTHPQNTELLESTQLLAYDKPVFRLLLKIAVGFGNMNAYIQFLEPLVGTPFCSWPPDTASGVQGATAGTLAVSGAQNTPLPASTIHTLLPG